MLCWVNQSELSIYLSAAAKVTSSHILRIEVELRLQIRLLLFLFLLINSRSRSSSYSSVNVVNSIPSSSDWFRFGRNIVRILPDAAMTTVTGAELEHQVITLVGPDVGQALVN